MAETEQITILKVGTDEAVKSIADLRENVKLLKQIIETTQVDTAEGWETYQNALEELKVNQNALKDAMYATSGSFEDVTKAATGAGESYNSLVHQMAALKEEFRSTNDAMRREDLGKQIKGINDKLKEMDALQGNFQRNVGNYAGSIKDAFGDMSQKVDVLKKSLGAVGGGMNGLKDGMEGISKSPMIATIGLLVSLAMKLAGELKDNKNAMDSIKKAMASLQPLMDVMSQVIESIANWLVKLIEWVTPFIPNVVKGMKSVVSSIMGVGNALLQFLLTPVRTIISAIEGLGGVVKHVFKGEFGQAAESAKKAVSDIGDAWKKGFSFKENFNTGKETGEAFLEGLASDAVKKKAEKKGKEVGKSIKDGVLKELEDLTDEINRQMDADFAAWEKAIDKANKDANKKADDQIKAIDKAAAHRKEMNALLVEDEEERAAKEYAIQEQANQKKLSLLDQFRQEALDRDDLDAALAYEQQRADLEVEMEKDAIKEKKRLRDEDLKDAKEKAKLQKDLMASLASNTSSILGSIADLYESDEKNAEKNANRIKALRIAAATIDTISGAIGAYMQATETIPPPYGAIVGAAQAAAITAAGVAQIAKMKSTKVSASAATSSSPVAAVTPAPALATEVSNVRSITSASEEGRLNQMAAEQRVYILSSDIEASQNQIKTRISESSF